MISMALMAVGTAVPYWSENEGSDVYGGEDILPQTGLGESLNVLEQCCGYDRPGRPLDCGGCGNSTGTSR